MSASVKEIWTGRGGSGDWHTGKESTRVFRVRMDSAASDEYAVTAVLAASPWNITFASQHPSNAYALCVKIDAQVATGRWWIVQVHYNTKLDFPEAAGGAPGSMPQDPASTSSNPSSRPPVYTFGSVIKKKARQKDNANQPLVNVNNQILVPPYEEEIPLLNMKISKAYATSALSLATFTDYRHTCNDDTWKGFAAYEVLCDDVTASSAQFENGFPYYNVEWSFIVDDIDGWYPTKILNAGTIERDNSGKLKHICDEVTGMPITQPVCLLSNGKRMPIGGTPHYLSFDLIYRSDFDTIPGI